MNVREAFVCCHGFARQVYVYRYFWQEAVTSFQSPVSSMRLVRYGGLWSGRRGCGGGLPGGGIGESGIMRQERLALGRSWGGQFGSKIPDF